MTVTPRRPDAPPRRRWWRVALVIALGVAGAIGAVACALAWLLMGFMGTSVAPWEPVVYPAGVVVCLSAPVLAGRMLLSRDGAPTRLALACGTVALLATGLTAGAVLAGHA